MDAGDDDLLAVGQEFDLLPLAAVGGDQVDDDLFERFFGAERDGAFRRLADTRQDMAALLVVLAHMVDQRPDRILTENVEIERRHEATQTAGIDRVRPNLRPQIDLLGGDVVQFLPPLQPFLFVVLAVDRRFLAVERNRTIAAIAELMPASLGVRHGRFS